MPQFYASSVSRLMSFQTSGDVSADPTSTIVFHGTPKRLWLHIDIYNAVGFTITSPALIFTGGAQGPAPGMEPWKLVPASVNGDVASQAENVVTFVAGTAPNLRTRSVVVFDELPQFFNLKFTGTMPSSASSTYFFVQAHWIL